MATPRHQSAGVASTVRRIPSHLMKAKLREGRCPASQPNQTWAMGKKIGVLAVVDIFSKFSPVVDPRFSYRAAGKMRADGNPR